MMLTIVGISNFVRSFERLQKEKLPTHMTLLHGVGFYFSLIHCSAGPPGPLRKALLHRSIHWLRTPDEALTISQTFWPIGQINYGVFGISSADLSIPILALWVPCPCFLLINHYFYKKPSLYIQIPKKYLGVGVELGPERIRNLVIVCP